MITEMVQSATNQGQKVTDVRQCMNSINHFIVRHAHDVIVAKKLNRPKDRYTYTDYTRTPTPITLIVYLWRSIGEYGGLQMTMKTYR